MELARVVTEEVVLPGDAEGLAAAILGMQADPDGPRRMRKHAREAAESRYEPEHILEAYAAVIGSLAGDET